VFSVLSVIKLIKLIGTFSLEVVKEKELRHLKVFANTCYSLIYRETFKAFYNIKT